MAPEPGIELSCRQNREIQRFMSDCTRKREYRRAFAIKMKGKGTPVNAVAEQLAVSRQSVSKWTATFMKKGAGGIRAAKRKKHLSDAHIRATARIRDVLHSEPVESNYLKGRWCIADIASLLNREGVAVSRSTVAGIFGTMKCVWKRPKLRASGSIHRDYGGQLQKDSTGTQKEGHTGAV